MIKKSDAYEMERIISLNGISVYAFTHKQLTDMFNRSTKAKILVEFFEIIEQDSIIFRCATMMYKN